MNHTVDLILWAGAAAWVAGLVCIGVYGFAHPAAMLAIGGCATIGFGMALEMVRGHQKGKGEIK